MSQKIRIKLKSFDHNLVDKSAEKIVKSVKATGAVISGPIALPTHKRIFTVNRSTFVNKKAREQFELSTYKRLIEEAKVFCPASSVAEGRVTSTAFLGSNFIVISPTRVFCSPSF